MMVLKPLPNKLLLYKKNSISQRTVELFINETLNWTQLSEIREKYYNQFGTVTKRSFQRVKKKLLDEGFIEQRRDIGGNAKRFIVRRSPNV